MHAENLFAIGEMKMYDPKDTCKLGPPGVIYLIVSCYSNVNNIVT